MPAPAPIPAFARRCGLWLSTALVLVVAGCAAPSTSERGGTPTPEVRAEVAAQAATPVQNPRRPTQPAGDAVKIDRSCNTDAECTVKDVGNCCGYYPACVNVDSPTDPDAVRAQCAKTGMASVCGFPAITSCQCVAGQCQGNSRALLE